MFPARAVAGFTTNSQFERPNGIVRGKLQRAGCVALKAPVYAYIGISCLVIKAGGFREPGRLEFPLSRRRRQSIEGSIVTEEMFDIGTGVHAADERDRLTASSECPLNWHIHLRCGIRDANEEILLKLEHKIGRAGAPSLSEKQPRLGMLGGGTECESMSTRGLKSRLRGMASAAGLCAKIISRFRRSRGKQRQRHINQNAKRHPAFDSLSFPEPLARRPRILGTNRHGHRTTLLVTSLRQGAP